MALSEPSPVRSRECDRIASDLRRMILRVELVPGAVVSEAFLTEKLQCGRTPLREAFQRLAAEYLVTCVPKHGVSVASLNIADFSHFVHMLILLEGPAVRQATPRVSEKDLCALGALVTQAEEANRGGDLAAVAELVVVFHETIVRASGNPYLADTITRLHRLCTRFGHIAWQHKASAEPSFAEHRRILAALADRDASAAEQLIGVHAEMSRERIRAAI
jgi:GntR family transcriptional regulator, rspAB operon transcriptional repressor